MSAESEGGGSLFVLGALGCVFAASAGALVWLAAQGMVGLSIVFGAILAALAVWIVVPIWRARRRARKVRRWASDHGWEAVPSPGGNVVGGTEVLRRVVDGVDVTSCTTEYDPDWRRGVDTTRYRHLLMSQVHADFPALTMVPTGGARRPPAGPAEGPGTEFEWAEFNSAWRVQSADARFMHAFCHPRLMERLMRPDVAGISVLVTGGEVAVHAPGATALHAVEARAALLADIVRLVPPHLIVEHRAPAETLLLRRVPTAVLRGAARGETTGWPTIVMTTIALGFVAWFVVTILRAGEVGFALGTIGVVAALGAVVRLSSRSVRRRRRDLARVGRGW